MTTSYRPKERLDRVSACPSRPDMSSTRPKSTLPSRWLPTKGAKDRGQTVSYSRVFEAAGLPAPQLLHQGSESHLVTEFMKAFHDRCHVQGLPPLDSLVFTSPASVKTGRVPATSTSMATKTRRRTAPQPRIRSRPRCSGRPRRMSASDGVLQSDALIADGEGWPAKYSGHPTTYFRPPYLISIGWPLWMAPAKASTCSSPACHHPRRAARSGGRPT